MLYTQNVSYHNLNGSISIQEVSRDPIFGSHKNSSDPPQSNQYSAATRTGQGIANVSGNRRRDRGSVFCSTILKSKLA
jgi:hypothetical protein